MGLEKKKVERDARKKQKGGASYEAKRFQEGEREGRRLLKREGASRPFVFARPRGPVKITAYRSVNAANLQ